MFEQIKQMVIGLDESIQSYNEAIEKSAQLSREISNIKAIKGTIESKYAKKYGYIRKATDMDTYSREDINRLRVELADNSIMTILKRFLGIGKNQEMLYREYMGKVNGLIAYLEAADSNCVRERGAAQVKIEAIAMKIEENYRRILMHTGVGSGASWSSFDEAVQDGEIYIGDVDILLENETDNCEQVLSGNMKSCYENGFVRIPYVKELMDSFQVVVEAMDEKQDQEAAAFMRSLIYQCIRTSPAYTIEIHLMDGEKTGADYAELMKLARVAEAEVIAYNEKVTDGKYKMVQTYLNDSDITQGLKKLDERIGKVAETLAGIGNVREYNQNKDKENFPGIIPQQIVVIRNFPVGFTDSDIRILNKLLKNGRDRGISFLIQYERKNRDLYKKYIESETEKVLDTITMETEMAFMSSSDCSASIHLNRMGEGHSEYIDDLIKKKTAVVERDNSFEAVIGIESMFGQENSMDGIHIPFAIDRRGNIVEYMLGSALNAHGLISGGTGSGKSTLLHMLISSVCMNYRPDDIELWLADYKIMEFNSYRANTPPHIRFIGLNTSIDFTYAFIDKMYNEMHRREQVIAEADAEVKRNGEAINLTGINDYRKRFGISSMRRVLIIVDEFHVMAQQANLESDYKRKLENILAEGRALGITLLLSDQAIVDGLNGLTDKGRKQIKARLALANERDELKAMLQVNDNELINPLMTMKRGEVAIIRVEEKKKADGSIEEVQKIERAKIIYIDGESRFKVCQKARKVFHAEDYVPDYSDETEIKAANWEAIANWEDENLKIYRDGSRDTYIYLGVPVNLRLCMGVPLLPTRTFNIMSIGGQEEQQYRLMQSIIASCVRQKEFKVFIFAHRYCNFYREYDLELERFSENPSIQVVTELDELCKNVNQLLCNMQDRKSRKKNMLIWFGMDSIISDLKEYPEEKPPCYTSTTKSARKKEAKEESTSQIFAALFGDIGDVSYEKDEESYDLEERMEDELVYNASRDIAALTHDGPAKGVWNTVFYETVASMKEVREIKLDDFRHKIAFSMSRDECADYLGRSTLLDDIHADKEIVGYYDGKSIHKFVPYAEEK